ncbi:TauD/TfdA dioxygenase family protein [Polyangium jinanense]|uniref:TauD/TfdA family dioxygenase n=1 Tax=Polyangium jinanense TaxID=2829994 RepID=A0A9X3XGW5_9BACT|nr:TauD/TfdA family dioxygenase [Polyangium jinanense]MDC3957721.1 TauD/TfdA family dioxygenase [Polyangium jinanense]MDC3987766.1 TauD/TfdA family dioxygenase [Polyangium jinanense]
MKYELIRVEPMVGALGAEIGGIDLTKPLADQAVAELKRAFVEHHLLVFRGQPIDVEHQKALGRHFGTLHVHPLFESIEGHPEVVAFVKEPEDRVNVGGGWHADLTCLERPPLGSILRVTETPARGGDTLFANMVAAYEALSPAMQKFLEGLTAIHTSAKVYGPWGKYAHSKGKTGAPAKIDNAGQHAAHPIVRTHPESGRKSLFVNLAYTIFIKGLSLEESTAILEFLYSHAVKGEFTTRLRWEKDTIAFWDNRCTQHYAMNDYHGMRRAALRVTIEGDRPA